MPDRSRRRAGSVRVLGRRRSTYLAHRLGIGLRESRVALAMTQAAASDRAGISQGFWSALEHGRGSAASLETLAACAAAVGTQLAAFVEATPGADLPRDIAHLRGQAAILRFAAPGGWIGSPEADIDVRSRRSRAIDVRLDRRDGREIAVVELVDLLADGGDALRGLSDKVRAVRHANPRAAVSGLLALRATARNRALAAELSSLLEARFPAPSAAWIAALTRPGAPVPSTDGFVWARTDGSALFAARRRAGVAVAPRHCKKA
ncbi:MAG TPA: helix-turn-helix transcriptional regulator [Candidatus Limnocylindrales bacterium]